MSEHQSGIYVENHSTTGWEPWILRNVCDPIARRIPESVTPNSISVVNHLVAWTVFILAATAPHLSPGSALAARLVAAVGVLASLILDCLDGIHARRTGQGSRLGEVVDHWLDAINVPLMAAGMALTLQLDPWTAALAMITSTMPYNAQLVLYHHTRRFVHPTTSGLDGQVMLAAAYVGFGFLFFFIPQTHHWMGLGLSAFALLVLALNLWLAWFYFARLRGFLLPHLACIGFFLAFAVLFWLGWISEMMFALAVIAISFRLSGSYVLYSVLGRPYSGIDWRIGVWLVIIAATAPWLEGYSYRGFSAREVAPLVFFLHLCTLNILDFIREVPALRPEAEKTTPGG